MPDVGAAAESDSDDQDDGLEDDMSFDTRGSSKQSQASSIFNNSIMNGSFQSDNININQT